MIDIQSVVECLQQDHTDLFPACSTYFDCGVTVFQKPAHSMIKEIWVADRTDPVSHHEDPEAAIQFCNKVRYDQIEATHMLRYRECHHRGMISTMALFFGFFCGNRRKMCYPAPTDEGLALNTLPALPLGIHYAQSSTDAQHRARHGVWAIERGKIYVAPWIQSSEVVIVKWDGLDRQMSDNSQMDSDPLLQKALFNYVRWQHALINDHEYADAELAERAYYDARADLVQQCLRETMVFKRTPSQASSSPASISNLYFNDTASSYTAQCPSGTTGDPVTITIPVGSVSSSSSVSDANAIAQAQAKQQAQAALQCNTGGGSGGGGTGGTFTAWNTIQPNVTVSCTSDDPDAPAPTGSQVTMPVPAGIAQGTGSTQAGAQAAANAAAIAQVTAQAKLGLHCTWYNSPQTAKFQCPAGNVITETTPAGDKSSTVSQDDANAQAAAAAMTSASSQCTGAVGNPPITQTVSGVGPNHCYLSVSVTVPQDFIVMPPDQVVAYVQNLAQQAAQNTWDSMSHVAGKCGTFNFVYPDLTTPV